MNEVKPRILCVDDEPVNIKLLNALLIPKRFDVINASNGKEALKKIENNNIDLVLLDAMMPEINGFEVCKKIKRNEKHRNIPVIMITVLASKKDRIQSIESGADDFITKPFDSEEVMARIEMLLRMKDLNDRINYGYHNIKSLTSFGEEIIKTFNPLSFDFDFTIDNIVRQVISKTNDIPGKPQFVVVGIIDKDNNWQWNQYEYTFKELYKTNLDLDARHIIKLLAIGKSMTGFYNKSEFEKSGFYPFIKNIENITLISFESFACHISGDFCIFAINYHKDVTMYDAFVLNNLVMQSMFLKSLSKQIKETEDAFNYTVQALIRASETNDQDTGDHVIRVGKFCAFIAEKLKMPENFIRSIEIQAQMHDVGMIYIPASIIKKPGKLTFDEWGIIRKHPVFGAKILGNHPKLEMAKNIALSHHEKWDGTGYPSWLRGERIPIEGRIASLADQYDSLRISRPYKSAFDHESAFDIITKGSERTKPTDFDPQVLKVFKKSSSQFKELFEKLTG